jgi:hypothetical protein
MRRRTVHDLALDPALWDVTEWELMLDLDPGWLRGRTRDGRMWAPATGEEVR